MKLFTHSGTVTPQQSKTNIDLSFTVPEGVDAVRVVYTYTPKTVASPAAERAVREGMAACGVTSFDLAAQLPVKNLITLSFDDPEGYRGACHRQPNEQHILLGTDSTPGILNRPVTAGTWHAVLNVHYAGCTVQYTLTAEGVSA
ncbi:MAG: hypothetical protein IJ168_00305 [Eubacterium sp.]|nr:hypothetical protein [Eubacterium sp.]